MHGNDQIINQSKQKNFHLNVEKKRSFNSVSIKQYKRTYNLNNALIILKYFQSNFSLEICVIKSISKPEKYSDYITYLGTCFILFQLFSFLEYILLIFHIHILMILYQCVFILLFINDTFHSIIKIFFITFFCHWSRAFLF